MPAAAIRFACLITLAIVALVPRAANSQSGRDYLYIVGSSTVYPFATVVAERFGRSSSFRAPKVESTGSGGGIKLFCDGVGMQFPDIVNASRQMTAGELERCRDNGVDSVIPVRIGYDGIVIANAASSPGLSVSSEQLFRALARRVPTGVDGELVANPYSNWSEVAASLPDMPIDVYGPPPTSGTRDAFVELVLEAGCRQTPWIAALSESEPSTFRSICHSVREDGRYVDAGENDNIVVQRLVANPRAFGIVGFSFLDQNPDLLQGASVDGVRPEFDNIATLDYPISRDLYFYVKSAHVAFVPGLNEFLSEFTAESTWGEQGYLSFRGLVPLPEHERREEALRIAQLSGATGSASRR